MACEEMYCTGCVPNDWCKKCLKDYCTDCVTIAGFDRCNNTFCYYCCSENECTNCVSGDLCKDCAQRRIAENLPAKDALMRMNITWIVVEFATKRFVVNAGLRSAGNTIGRAVVRDA